MERSDNPLLSDWTTPHALPPFDLVQPEHFAPAFQAAWAAHRAELDAIAAQAEEEAKNDSKPAPFGGVQQAIENAGVEDSTPPILCYFWIAGDLTGPWSADAALGPGNHAASSAALAVIDFP